MLDRRPTKQANETVDAARIEEVFWQKGKDLESVWIGRYLTKSPI